MGSNKQNDTCGVATGSPSSSSFKLPAICRYGNAAIMIFLALYFFIIPFCTIIYDLTDPGLKGEGIAKYAFRLHRGLSPRYEKWARNRIESKQAEQLGIDQIAATEWPVFGSVFYLWASEALQQSWEKDNSTSSVAPNIYARNAIEAAAALVADPGHASWVKLHWGEQYLHRENVFYRMLLIGGLTSYHKLLGGDKYLPLIKDQVESLSKELDESPYGLLDDYPDQCFPTDIVAAIASINRADALLGTDHSDFVKRSIRGFQGELLDSTGLPPYMAESDTGYIDIARGCSSQWMTVWAPELWPETAKQWYDNFDKHFWQEHWTAVGFREFTKETRRGDWYFDVDSGPVVAGFGVAAGAFGVGAARANGRFDHAYPLSAEVIAMSWPLPHGSLFTAQLLSNGSHAPYLGEAAILFTLTRTPPHGSQATKAGPLPIFVYFILFIYFAVGATLILATIINLKRRSKRQQKTIPLAEAQFAIWAILILSAIVIIVTGRLSTGLLPILLAQLLPRGIKKLTNSAEASSAQTAN